MHDFRQRLFAHLRHRAAAYLVLLVALVPTVIAYWRVHRNVHVRDQGRFTAISQKTSAAVEDHMKALVSDLRAFSGLIEANPAVTRTEWNTFIETLGYDRRHPGVRSIGYAEKVTSDRAAQFVTTMRTRVGAQFDIFPAASNWVTFPTVHVRQFPTNIDVRLGWDAYTDAPRQEALDRVMDKVEPSVTRKCTYWIGDTPEAEGFTIFVPVRAPNGAMRGVVFSSIIPQYLFNTLSNRQFDGSVSVEMFEGKESSEEFALAACGVPEKPRRASYVETIPMRVLDREFSIRVSTLPAFDAHSEHMLPQVVLACGLGFTFLLFGIAWAQANSRRATEEMNGRLRDSQEQLKTANAELEQRIAESKITEGLLAYERDLLRMLLEHSPDPIYFKDTESRFIKGSKALTRHLGVKTVTEALGKTDFDFFSEAHARPAFECEQEIIRTGKPKIGIVEKETWVDGRETWVLTSKMPLRDKHGRTIGTFGISKDITQLKFIETALEKEKDQLAVTLRSIADGVITTDVGGRVVLMNQVAERLTGWTQAKAKGRPLKEVFRTKDAQAEESNTEMLRRALDENTRQAARDSVLVARDDSERNVSQSLAPIINQSGQNVGAVLVFRDITEKLKTEAELLKASKLESIGALAGGIAHDFNNVLTVILGNISLARMAAQSGMQVGDALQEAENASLRARELTNRLLTFAKGGAPIKRPIDLVPVVRESATRVLFGSEVVPEYFIGEDLWAIEADEAQIGQVLQNIISYARSAASKEPRLDIHVLNQEVSGDPLLLLEPGRYVRVSIRDYGDGIQPENLSKIFEPYFGAQHGSGLELATAYSIVRKHEGQIRVESVAGHGTVFHVYLPVAGNDSPDSERKPARADAPLRAPQRVLVMDDEMPIRRLATLLLERIGCSVATAADGAEAIEIYQSARERGEPFGAVIMDLTVPNGMGGKEAIAQLKQIDPEVRAIVSSGYSNDPVMANYREYGFAGVMPKPYSSDDLVAGLGELFREADCANQ